MSAPSADFMHGYRVGILHALQHVNGYGDCGSHLYEDLIHEAGGLEVILKIAQEQGGMEWSGLAHYLEISSPIEEEPQP